MNKVEAYEKIAKNYLANIPFATSPDEVRMFESSSAAWTVKAQELAKRLANPPKTRRQKRREQQANRA